MSHRVSALRARLRWPELPAERLPVLRRLADACPIHATLAHGLDADIEVEGAR